MHTALVMAGIPATNLSLFHAVRFNVGDPTAFVRFADGTSLFLCRDIELHRAAREARATRVAAPAEFAPVGGLSPERETATAQALAEALAGAGITRAVADRSLPLIYAEFIRRRGIEVALDTDLGVLERRRKDEAEIAALAEAQAATEEAMLMACTTIARARAGADGVLMHDGAPLTAERVNTMIDVFFLERGYTTPGSIVACGQAGSDCHNRGSGPLRTGEPIIVDIFPTNRRTRYSGDCTRTVVHGTIPPTIARMHAAVKAAKAAGIAAARAGVTADSVYQAAIDVIRAAGFDRALLPEHPPADFCSMQHGLGHGIGLEVHEPPLVDAGGPELIAGDAFTVEPGLYHATLGGIRIEDIVVVTETGCRNLNRLHEELDWT
ncbi:MAG: aminopeptidase P family protein [Phycisphaeraceae bacterium]|nr:aminopeptidase P family protein [Phycisphaeraceae bacterium]MCW5763166.1 aminopeptidase P family protein [Phycisphaeraceae bacterium]